MPGVPASRDDRRADDLWSATIDPVLQLIEGHPLALKLIAAALRSSPQLSPQGLLLRLQARARVKEKADTLMQVPESTQDCFHDSIAQLPPGPLRPFLIAIASQSSVSWPVEAADYVSGVCDRAATEGHLKMLVDRGLVEQVADGRYRIHRLLRDYLRAVHGREGFGFIPRTWEIARLPWLLLRLRPGISAGSAIYDIRQEHWALEYARKRKTKLDELRREWSAIVLGFTRRNELGFGDAARGRLEELRHFLRWSDLSGLRLDRAQLDGVDLKGINLHRADLSGTPSWELPPLREVKQKLWAAAKTTTLSAGALAISLAIYRLGFSSGLPYDPYVLLPVAFVGAPPFIVELLLKTRAFQRERLDLSQPLVSMRLRYAIERGTELLVFYVLGAVAIPLIEHILGKSGLFAHFSKAVGRVALLYALATWATWKLAGIAGRFYVGGFGIRLLTAAIMSLLVVLSIPAIFGEIHPWKIAIVLGTMLPGAIPMVIYALAVGLLLNPERHLLTSLWTSHLRSADLTGADLTEANLRWTKLAQAILRFADLTGANLEHADLGGAVLVDATMSRANLRGANLKAADLSGAELTSANLTSIVYDDATRWPKDFVPPPSSDEEPPPTKPSAGDPGL